MLVPLPLDERYLAITWYVLMSVFVLGCSFVGRIFKRWRLTKKKIKRWAVRKFTLQNIIYYCVYVTEVLHIPVLNLKYLDEASFENSDVRQNRGWSQAGRPLVLHGPRRQGPTYTMFALTDLRLPRGFLLSLPHTGRNCALDFVQFIIYAISQGSIAPGDVVILDSSSIHKARFSLAIVGTLFDLLGCRLVFQPKYSPELNACELIWAYAKNNMRNRRGDASFDAELLRAFNGLNRRIIAGFYYHVLYNFQHN
jgi:transposase